MDKIDNSTMAHVSKQIPLEEKVFAYGEVFIFDGSIFISKGWAEHFLPRWFLVDKGCEELFIDGNEVWAFRIIDPYFDLVELEIARDSLNILIRGVKEALAVMEGARNASE